MALQWYLHGLCRLLRGQVWWHCSGIPTAFQSTSSWPSLVALQWYSHGFAVNIFVAEFGGTAVVSPRFSSKRFSSQFLRGRVWWYGSGIPTVLRSISLRPSLVERQWYARGFAIKFFVAGGMAVVPHSIAINIFVAKFGGIAVVSPLFLQSTSSCLSLVARQWYPHGLAVNFFVAEFGGTAVVSPRFCSQILLLWLSLVAPRWCLHGLAVFLWPNLLTRYWLFKVLWSLWQVAGTLQLLQGSYRAPPYMAPHQAPLESTSPHRPRQQRLGSSSRERGDIQSVGQPLRKSPIELGLISVLALWPVAAGPFLRKGSAGTQTLPSQPHSSQSLRGPSATDPSPCFAGLAAESKSLTAMLLFPPSRTRPRRRSR